MNSWKRRWCVLKDETFLWFRSKQEALKQGWLHKKGGGSSTLSRRNWKRRWFVLRQSKLMYFENDSEEKLKGTVEVRTAKYVPAAWLLDCTDGHVFSFLKVCVCLHARSCMCVYGNQTSVWDAIPQKLSFRDSLSLGPGALGWAGRPASPRDSPVSASPVLRLLMCANAPSSQSPHHQQLARKRKH